VRLGDRVEVGVVAEDARLQLDQLGPGSDPELVGEHPAGPVQRT
jgi:hypothetical protein